MKRSNNILRYSKRSVLVVFFSFILLFSFITVNREARAEDGIASGGLYISNSYPKDYDKSKNQKKSFLESIKNLVASDRVSTANVGVKLYFTAVGNSKIPNTNKLSLRKENRKKLYFVNPSGKAIKAKVYFSKNEENYVLALIDNGKKQLQSDSIYTLVIKAGFKDADGNVLKKKQTISFKTVNSDLNNKVYMILMVVMFIGMFGYMAIKKRRDEKKAANPNMNKEKPVNPYEIARKTGKNVQDVIKDLEKKKIKEERKKQKQAKLAADSFEDDEDDDLEDEIPVKKVGGKKAISSLGYTYKK